MFYGSMSGGQREPDKIRVLRGEGRGEVGCWQGTNDEGQSIFRTRGSAARFRDSHDVQCRGCLVQENERQRGRICGMNECTWQGRDE